MTWKIHIITLFPEMFPGALGLSLSGKALLKDTWQIIAHNIRDFGIGKHKSVDDTIYGGGCGMLIRPDVLGNIIDHVITQTEYGKNTPIIYMSPRGQIFNQLMASDFVKIPEVIIICGRYEGIDQRVIDFYNIREVSIGNYILSGGEIAAMTIIDACVRLLPDVLGNEASIHEESFAVGTDYENLLEYPQYTKPAVWHDLKVPEILQSGNHAEIAKWRLNKAEEITKERNG